MKLQPTLGTSATSKLNQSNAEQTVNATNKLTVGQLVRATVLEIIAESDAALLEIGGQVVRAQNQSGDDLVPGKAIYVRIAERTSDMLVVKIEDASAVAVERSIDNELGAQLQRMGIDNRTALKGVLRAMYEQQMPITRDNVIALRDDIAGFKQIVGRLNAQSQTADQTTSLGVVIDWTKPTKSIILTIDHPVAPPEAKDADVAAGEKPRGDVLPTSDGGEVAPAKVNVTKPDSPATVAPKAMAVGGRDALVSKSSDADKAAVFGSKADAQPQPVERSVAESGTAKAGLSRHMNAILTQKLAAIDGRGTAQVSRLFAAMQKFNVPRTPLNTVLFDQLMQGKTDALAAVLDAIEPDRLAVSDKLATLLERFGESIIEYRDISEEGLGGKELKQLADLNISLNKILIEASVRSETGQRAEQVEVAKQNLNLLTDQVNWQAIHIPMRLKDEIRDVEVYVRGDAKKGGCFNPDDGLVYIALNTENLATVKVKLYFKGDQLSIVFLAESDAYRDHLKAFDKALVDAVGALVDKPVSVSYGIAEQEANFSEMVKVADIQLSSFDQRI